MSGRKILGKRMEDERRGGGGGGFSRERDGRKRFERKGKKRIGGSEKGEGGEWRVETERKEGSGKKEEWEEKKERRRRG